MTPSSAPQMSQAKKPETKTFHKGHRPPALLPEQTGKWVWVPEVDRNGKPFWRLKKDILSGVSTATSSHDSGEYLVSVKAAQAAAKASTVVEDPSGTLSMPERATR